jgi:CRP/FNR family transcriptional regulator, cyclic AMP receptor protein
MGSVIDLVPLDRVGWLADQPADFRAWVAVAGRWSIREPGQLLYEAGDEADGLYGLADGSLDITFPLVAEEPVSLYRAEVGFWIGDLALLAGTERLVSVRIRRRARLLTVPGPSILAHLRLHPEHWPCFYALTQRNMATALAALSEALALPPATRVARRMLQLADRDGVIALTQEELASLVGVTRVTVRRALQRLIDAGAVETGYGSLRILRRDVVERRAVSTE